MTTADTHKEAHEMQERPETKGPYEARIVPNGMPADCCKYGVVSLSEGREVCRVWLEQDARAIAAALASAKPAQAGEVEALVKMIANSVTDWDGTAMPDGAEPVYIPNCGELRAFAAALRAAEAQLAERTRERDKARAEMGSYELYCERRVASAMSEACAAEARKKALREALDKLLEAAEVSDDTRYGTLSTSFVRDIARAALASAQPAQAGEVDRLTAERDEAVKALEEIAVEPSLHESEGAYWRYEYARQALASIRSRSEPSRGG